MKILLIVTGSIAAIKVYDLVRILIKQTYQVTVVLTQAAQKFVTIEAMTVLTGQKTYTSLFDLELEQNIGHIALSRDVDKILVAPATAHIMAQMAHGLCDNLATTLLAASNKPIYCVPAMNPFMWENPAHQNNLKLLSKNPNIYIISPEKGLMACGETGLGRMAEIETIIDALQDHCDNSLLKGQHILITAGATVEKIDPVRFISNFSSGKQGIALAEEALKMGAKVTLITGKMTVDIPTHINFIQVQTADEMLNVCLAQLPVDIAICTAAVCDWKPEYQAQKMKKQKNDNNLTLNFVKNPDILQIISGHTQRPKYVIGFAAETNNVLENAVQKLVQKSCDVIYANKTDEASAVFGSDLNSVIEITKNTQETLDKCSKNMVSKWILNRIPNSVLKK
jgi:phosphopantothenoylcysteine decarboxylase/phosphopantothenate--cysteine ligase